MTNGFAQGRGLFEPAAVVAGIAGTIALAVINPVLTLAIPAMAVGAVLASMVVQRPLLFLFLILTSPVLTLGRSSELTLIEVGAAVLIISYSASSILGTVYRGEQLINSRGEGALLTLLVLIPASSILTIAFNGHAVQWMRELYALSYLAVYFPVARAVRTRSRGLIVVASSVILLGTFAAIRNLIEVATDLGTAEFVWQLLRERSIQNDNLLMASSALLFGLIIFASRKHILLIAAGLVVNFAGLLLTQSRTYWLTFLFAAVIIFVKVDQQRRSRVLLGVLTVAVSGLLAIWILLGDFLPLFIASLVNRFASIGSAATSDLSLINRFRESEAVWREILQSPIIGKGAGVSYHFFDLTRFSTDTDTFAHNGYLGIWQKFGIVGLGLLLYFWFRTIGSGFRAISAQYFRERPLEKSIVLAATASIAVTLLSALVSNPFYLDDTVFLFAIVVGMVNGSFQRATAIQAG